MKQEFLFYKEKYRFYFAIVDNIPGWNKIII